jgi:hypothetical protein
MTTWEPEDAVQEELSPLRVHDAPLETAERIRARCVAALAAPRRADEVPREGPPPWRTWLEPALALGLGAVYLAEAVTRALALYR